MSDRLYAHLVPAFLVAALIAGGASAAGILANLLLQLLALPLLVVAVQRLRKRTPDRAMKITLALFAAIILLPVLQVVPLPAAVWTQLSGRSEVIEGMRTLDVAPGLMGISLDPWSTLASIVWLLVPSAAFLSVLTLDEEARRRIGWWVLGVAAVSALLGLLQYTAGSTLYFYQISNFGSPVGFFPNRNHFATLMLCALPILTLQIPINIVGRLNAANKWGMRVVMGAALLIVTAMIALSGSRAGLGLILPTLALCYALKLRSHRGSSPWPVLIIAAVIGTLVVGALLVGPESARMLAKSTGDDVRLLVAPATIAAGWKFFPFGTGIGSFDRIFRWQENAMSIRPSFINHAHNDYLETWLTGGAPAILLILCFFAWFLMVARANWTTRAVDPSQMSRIATVCIVVMMLHSAVDYPLRTAALAALFAAFCAMQLPATRPRPIMPNRRDEPRRVKARGSQTVLLSQSEAPAGGRARR